MTGAQASYLQTLCEEAGEVFDETGVYCAIKLPQHEWRRAPQPGAG
jgi:Protein of unknown function (DUF3072)